MNENVYNRIKKVNQGSKNFINEESPRECKLSLKKIQRVLTENPKGDLFDGIDQLLKPINAQMYLIYSQKALLSQLVVDFNFLTS